MARQDWQALDTKLGERQRYLEGLLSLEHEESLELALQKAYVLIRTLRNTISELPPSVA